MKFFIQWMFLLIVLMSGSSKGMIKTLKKVKVKKAPKSFAVGAKNIKFQSPQVVGTSVLPKETGSSDIHQQPKMPSGIKMKEMPRSAWQQQRSYSTLGNTPFNKKLGLLKVKTEQAKQDLQKRGYSTIDERKTDFFKKVRKRIEKGDVSLLKEESVRKRLGEMMSPKSIQQFVDEPIDLSAAKKLLINEAEEKGVYIPIDASEEVRLAYGWIIQNIRDFLKDPMHKPFVPMINRALTEEKEALEQGKPVLYHGLKKDYYKYMYFCTKIMELKELFYPGFLMLRATQKDYTPQGSSTTMRKSFLKKGSKNDLLIIKDRYHLLSTSNSLFTNFEKGRDVHPLWLTVKNESATDFLIDKGTTGLFTGEGVSKLNIDLESFCKKYQLEDYYTKIEGMFTSTDIKSDGGILLQFILSKDLFDKAVYASYAGGHKREDSSKIIKNMPNIAALDNETLRRLQFRMILTDDFLLNPTNPEVRKGFKVNAYVQDQKALYEFQTKVDEFFEGIKKELMQKKKKEEPRQNTRTWSEYVKSFFTRRDSGKPGKK